MQKTISLLQNFYYEPFLPPSNIFSGKNKLIIITKTQTISIIFQIVLPSDILKKGFIRTADIIQNVLKILLLSLKNKTPNKIIPINLTN